MNREAKQRTRDLFAKALWWRLPLGTLAGFPVYLHVSFLVMALGVTIAGGLVGAMIIALALVSIVLHELGHAIVARRYGIAAESVEVTFLGGFAIMELTRNPRAELSIAIAGPIVSLVLGLVSFAAWRVVELDGLAIAGMLNVGLAIFNMLPAFPLDGGRVLRAALALRRPYLRATEIAVQVAKVCLLLLLPFCLWVGSYTTIFGLVLLWQAGTAERLARRAEISAEPG